VGLAERGVAGLGEALLVEQAGTGLGPRRPRLARGLGRSARKGAARLPIEHEHGAEAVAMDGDRLDRPDSRGHAARVAVDLGLQERDEREVLAQDLLDIAAGDEDARAEDLRRVRARDPGEGHTVCATGSEGAGDDNDRDPANDFQLRLTPAANDQ
jgi:hypothetical protein